ncbi:TrkA family potassium uptake protein [Gordonia rubripertincta]|uniref:Trk system potassium uptake protein TrkA n=2 Tax=Gordonia rubripertincta TaxID=36822 RepID=A0AAW4G6G2_GORRU|nr:TrkA family potassium uptake protein [Gordonia rubripertincta]ASR03602.1 Trk system potassium uptake protein TrkA [Gordonia rubripertincta]MBM7278726.1 TrkA family potassium uptake protein [Gordonia rubripertincta]MDG6779985.1 TrkA family potassium uptake protein [Gordonia rubripertincta]NKY61173.1 TrkA family potassium uptake protein [Gordonia rubripertincta]NKY61926.1 TrkA family potassium uptake protein [Gordonia rubripertincta]
MQVVIMGCGRVGSSLAMAMQKRGHDVAIIDRDPSAFARLSVDFAGRTITGVGFDRDILVKAGIEHADAFAAVSSGDNSNIIAARVARETFDVERVVARIYDAKRAEVYERLGIPTVATVPWTTERFVSALGEIATTEWRDPSGTLAVAEIDVDESWIGVSVAKFQEQSGARVVFLNRVGRPVLPEAKTVLQQDDVVYGAVLLDNLANARRIAAAPFIQAES